MKEYLLLTVVLVICQIIYCEKIIRCPRYGKHYFAHPLECTEFVMCVDGKSKINKCSPGTHYDPIQQLCGPVECNRCYAYPSDEKTYLHSTRDCTEYFICLGHIQVAHRCPTGMYYDRYREICDYKDAVECIKNELPPIIIDYPESPVESSAESSAEISEESPAESQPQLSAESPGELSEESPVETQPELSAESPTEISAESSIELLPPITDVPIVSIPPHIDIPQSEIENDEYVCPANGFHIMPHPTICSWYYWCENGKSHLQSCFPGLIFDGKTKDCVPPANGVCFSNYKPVCTYKQQSFEPHAHSCRHYFICIHGKISLQKCAEDLSFDMNTRKCNNPSISKCFVEE